MKIHALHCIGLTLNEWKREVDLVNRETDTVKRILFLHMVF